MRRRPSTLLVVLLSVSTLSAACGLKQDQLDALKTDQSGTAGTSTLTDGGGTGGGAPTGTSGGSTGEGVPGASGTATGAPGIGATTGSLSGAGGGSGTSGTSGTTGTAGGGTTGTSGTTGGTGTSGTTSTSGSVGGTKCSTLGSNVPGVTPTEIRIGIHAPQTGTGAPLPPSFAKGAGVYWKTHKVCGRTVVVDFQDDKYTPSTARDVCEPMSRRDFLVVGAAGTDQIQSCATDPAIAGKVPYLSAGVTTNGLTGLKNYFAFTLTYAQQATLVLQNARNQHLGMKKWAVITSNTNNFKDAREAMEGVLKAAGVPFDDIQVNATNDNGLQGRAAATGTKIATGGYDTVFLDTSPGYFIYMSGTASKQGFNGVYTGPGVTMTEVTVAQLVCAATGGVVKANFLAPYPGIDRATADFKTANGTDYDDIYWSLWGLSQAIDQALQNSASLTRPAFISSLEQGALPGGVYPAIRFNGSHFGGTGAYSQVMNCNKAEPNAGAQRGAWDTVGGLLNK